MSSWPEPSEENVDDRRRRPTHRLICFQHGGSLQDSSSVAQSWCALFPLDAQPFTPPEVVLRLENDRATLLDLDPGAQASAAEISDKRWEVRPIEGPEVLVGHARSGPRPGYAEASGLLPLFIPRPGRRASRHATALVSKDWSGSHSLSSVKASRVRSAYQSRSGWVDVGASVLAFLPFVALSGDGILAAGIAGVLTAGMVLRQAWRQRSLDAGRRVDLTTAPAATVTNIDWRPSDEGGCLAWILVDDDEHHRLEAPIVGLVPGVIDAFPTMTTIDGRLRPGNSIVATLPDGTALRTTRPLAAAKEPL